MFFEFLVIYTKLSISPQMIFIMGVKTFIHIL